LCAAADREARRASHSWRSNAAVESRRRRSDRRHAGIPVAWQSGVLSLRLRFLLRLRGGRPADWPHRTRQCRVARKIVSAIGRVDYCRVRIVDDRVEPIALAGASILSSTTKADGFVIIPAESEGYGPGSE